MFRPTLELPRRTISTGWCATITCVAGPTSPTSRSTCCPRMNATRRAMKSPNRCAARLQPVAARCGARIKVAEVPPGPPVLETLVAEVYGPSLERTDRAGAAACGICSSGPDGVVDVDWYVEDDQPKYRLIVDQEKAALNGVSEDDIARAMQMASAGYEAGLLHQDAEKEDVPLSLRLDRAHPLRSRPPAESARSRAATGNWWRERNGARRKDDRGQEHLSQESDAGDLCHRATSPARWRARSTRF